LNSLHHGTSFLLILFNTLWAFLISLIKIALVVSEILKVELKAGKAGVMIGITFFDFEFGFQIVLISVFTSTEESLISQRRIGSGQPQ